MKKIVFTGGGTAGHVYPALAVIEGLDKSEYEIHYIGGKGIEKEIIETEKNIIFHQIDTVKLQRKFTFQNFLIPIKLYKSITQSKKILKYINPNIIFSKGGFVAVPVAIAGARLGVPVISHESDLSMGLANKIILHYCKKMCTTFPQTCKKNPKTVCTGQPIRNSILNGNKTNLEFYKALNPQKPKLLIVGGSSGARFINEKVWENLDRLCKTFNVIHLTGKSNKEKHEHKDYHQIDYANNIGDFLSCADIILSRAGSGAINEFLALKKPMLLIPLSKKCSRGDQIENAKLFKENGYCEMIEEEDFTNSYFIKKLENMHKNAQKYTKNMQKSDIFDAKSKIIEIIKQNEKEG